MKPPPPPPRVVCIEVPVLSPRAAEVLIDLFGQVQGALWDAYGDAILDHAADDEPSPEEYSAQSTDPTDEPPF